MRFSRFESGRNPAQKIDLRPGTSIAYHPLCILTWKVNYIIVVLVDFGLVFGQSWARDRYQRLRLENGTQFIQKLARETDSKTVS